MNSDNLDLLNQALDSPFEDLNQLDMHIENISCRSKWENVGILFDEGIKAILILLLTDNEVISILRICMSVTDSEKAINKLMDQQSKLLLGCYQGYTLTQEDIHSISCINEIWQSIPEQIKKIELKDAHDFFHSVEISAKKTGRGANISTTTKRTVIFESHGRCMFEGCGKNLGIDDLTGTEGNYSYLAHNVASSEQGARGAKLLSEKLSDEPNNILLLCDKHHRLVDKVGAIDYPASRLSQMRKDFNITSTTLLDALSFQSIPAFAVLWPVHRQTVAAPDSLQIAQSYKPMRWRLKEHLNDISDNEALLRNSDIAVSGQIQLESIKQAADKILSQSHSNRYAAGLFAIGLMPALIGLGALLGNKINIIPMLRYRDDNQWKWPFEKPIDDYYSISGIDTLTDIEEEVTLTIAFTSEPESLISARNEAASKYQTKHIIVKAHQAYLGNGAIGHPKNGLQFSTDMQKLLHQLRNDHNVQRVHLFTCASNAACVFLGQAFDSHHPEIVIYDFYESSMKPVYRLVNISNQCTISIVEKL